MPISQDSLSYEDMQKLAASHVCSECGASLVTCWGGAYGINSYIVRCTKDPKHNGIGQLPRNREYNIKTREEFMTQDHGKETALALRKYNGVAVLGRESATDILVTLFPGADKASPAEFQKAIGLCVDYGLDPRTKDLYMLPFKVKVKDANGKVIGEKTVHEVVRGISTSRKIAKRKHHYSFIEHTPRYMTEDEEKRVYKTVDTEMIRYIVITKDMDTGAETPGYGQWPKFRYWYDKQGTKHQELNQPKGIDKGNSMENMASTRAERNNLDRAYPMDMPANVRVVDDIDAEVSRRAGSVDAEARDVTDEYEAETAAEMPAEGTASHAEELLKEEAKAAPTAAKASPPVKASTIQPLEKWEKITREKVKTWLDLLPVAHDLAGLQPQELYREMGGTCMADMTISAWDAFQTIKEKYYPKAPAEA